MYETAIAHSERVFDHLFAGYDGPPFAIRLWDGWRWAFPAKNPPACTLVLRSEDALRSLLAHPNEVSLGEAFVSKDIDVEGDLFSVFALAEHVFRRSEMQHQRFMELFAGLFFGIGDRWHRGKRHSPERDRAAISYHYDQPVEFYRPWLGETLVYSCGYFAAESDSLDTAQTNKLELICRKLGLKPSEHLLDIGCGWGSLVMHAAARHDVFAQGITLSREQRDVANQRIASGCLIQSCKVDLLDYRSAPLQFGKFDKIASVGMFEHVGAQNLAQYFRTAYELLKPGGVMLNHGIARAWSSGYDSPSFIAWPSLVRSALGGKRRSSPSFIDQYVFPDGELVPVSEAVRVAEAAGFEVRDVENLREHYELTLRRWTEALRSNAEEVLRHVSERTYRIWMLYMAGCAAAFHRGDIGLYQILLSRPDHGHSHLPLTRGSWYSATNPQS